MSRRLPISASGPSSLQDAVDRRGPRIVVFEVTGAIQGDLRIPYGDLTIAGQTAPGGGITSGLLCAPYPTTIGNIVIRHARIRAPEADAGWPPEQHGAIQFRTNRLIMHDLVYVSHAIDEFVDP